MQEIKDDDGKCQIYGRQMVGGVSIVRECQRNDNDNPKKNIQHGNRDNGFKMRLKIVRIVI